MANRYFYQQQNSLEKDVTFVFATINIGATGAPTLVAAESNGVASIARTAQGDYRLTLSDAYNKLLAANFNLVKSTAEDITFQIKANSIGSKIVDFFTNTGATATDPASGGVLKVMLVLKNSGV